jgi:hypothetical protein
VSVRARGGTTEISIESEVYTPRDQHEKLQEINMKNYAMRPVICSPKCHITMPDCRPGQARICAILVNESDYSPFIKSGPTNEKSNSCPMSCIVSSIRLPTTVSARTEQGINVWNVVGLCVSWIGLWEIKKCVWGECAYTHRYIRRRRRSNPQQG